MTASPAPASTPPHPAELAADLATRARAAALPLSNVGSAARRRALHAIADSLLRDTQTLQAENVRDLDRAPELGLSDAMVDRLRLTEARIQGMADGMRQVAAQPDPVGEVLEGRTLDNGLRLQKRRVPIGVVLIIFESRPNVTADAAALCLKSGNAAILRGGKEALHSNRAIAAAIQAGLKEAGLDPDVVQLVPSTDRAVVGELLQRDQEIDLCIPRGGESLIRAVVEQARIPVIKHYTGNCHTYVHADADPDQAVAVCLNAKTQRTGVCNATETFLFHRDTVESGLADRVLTALSDAGVALSADGPLRQASPGLRMEKATDDDFAEEFLSLRAAAGTVDGIDAAAEHINRFGSRHTDAILCTALDAAEAFTQRVDTANVMINCSTRFSDGEQYGLGAEIGISTDKLHARGPMGAADLTTYQWVVQGSGQIRT